MEFEKRCVNKAELTFDLPSPSHPATGSPTYQRGKNNIPGRKACCLFTPSSLWKVLCPLPWGEEYDSCVRILVLGGVLHKGPSSAEAQGQRGSWGARGVPHTCLGRAQPPTQGRAGGGRPSVGEFYLP